MKWLWRVLIGLVGLEVLGAIGFRLFQPQIAEGAFARAISENVGVDRSADLPDGFHV